MAVMTRTSLIESLRRHTERGNPTDTEVYEQVPELITYAERDIARKLKVLGMLEVVTGAMTAESSVLTKPERWLATAHINYGIGTSPNQERRFLYPRSYEYLTSLWPNREEFSEDDPPQFYADYNFDHWLIVPTPALAYPIEIGYWAQPEFLSETNETNWLTEHAPDALLYGTLVLLAPFLKSPDLSWSSLYADRLATLNGEDLQRVIDRTTTRRGV